MNTIPMDCIGVIFKILNERDFSSLKNQVAFMLTCKQWYMEESFLIIIMKNFKKYIKWENKQFYQGAVISRRLSVNFSVITEFVLKNQKDISFRVGNNRWSWEFKNKQKSYSRLPNEVSFLFPPTKPYTLQTLCYYKPISYYMAIRNLCFT